jgi:hypothetical protein
LSTTSYSPSNTFNTVRRPTVNLRQQSVKMKVTTVIATLFFGTAVMAAPGAVNTPSKTALELALFLSTRYCS